MKKIFAICFLAVMLILGACSQQTNNGDSAANNGSSGGENRGTKVMKMASADPEVRPSPKALAYFKEIVERETGGSIKVEIYHSAQLGGDRETLEGMQIGTIEGAVISTGPVSGFLPRIGVFDLPFIFPNKPAAYEVLDGPIGMELLEELRDQGIVGLTYWENGVRHLTNNIREVTSLENLAGLKIRVMEAPIHIDLWNTLGANATPMAWTEVFPALQQGVIDGQENPAGNVQSNKLYEVQKYLTTTGHVYAANLFMVSEKFWDTLTDEEKEIVRNAAVEARDHQRQLADEEEVSAFNMITEEGMTITHLTEEEAQRFFEQVQPVYEKYSKDLGEELVNKVVEAARP